MCGSLCLSYVCVAPYMTFSKIYVSKELSQKYTLVKSSWQVLSLFFEVRFLCLSTVVKETSVIEILFFISMVMVSVNGVKYQNCCK